MVREWGFGLGPDGGDACEFGLSEGAIFAVGDAEPAGIGAKDLHAGAMAVEHGLEGEGEVELGFEFGAALLEKFGEGGLEFFGVGGLEAEEVHGDGGVVGDDEVAIADDTIGAALDCEAFFDVEEVAVGIHFADTARDATIGGEGAIDAIADHAIGIGFVGGAVEVVCEDAEAVGAIVVIGIGDGKGGIEEGARGECGMTGAPGLGASGGRGEAMGEVFEGLDGIVEDDATSFPAIADDAAHIGFEVGARDEDDLIEACGEGIADGVVEDELSVGSDGVHLFESAIAGAHTGGENDEAFEVHEGKSFEM